MAAGDFYFIMNCIFTFVILAPVPFRGQGVGRPQQHNQVNQPFLSWISQPLANILQLPETRTEQQASSAKLNYTPEPSELSEAIS